MISGKYMIFKDFLKVYMKLAELKETRAAKVQEMRSLADKAEMSADDLARFDALKADVQKLEQQEERALFLQEAERRALGNDKQANKLAGAVSILEAINAQVEGRSLTGATAEYSAEVERRTGKRGVFLPLSAFESRAAQTTTTAESIVPDDFRADLFVGPLRNSRLVQSLGATVLTGLRGDVVVPRHKTGMTAQWIAEGESLTESGMTFDTIKLQPRHIGAMTELSRQLLQQSSPSIEALVRNDMSEVMAEAFDLALLVGDGTKQPLGIFKTVGIQTANLATLSWAAVQGMMEKLAIKNVSPNAWLTSPQAATVLRTTLKSASSGAGYLMEGGRMADMPVAVTNQVPLKTKAGQILLGDFRQLLIGVWDSVQILANPYDSEAYARGGVKIRALMTADAVVRRPEAFVLASDIVVQA